MTDLAATEKLNDYLKNEMNTRDEISAHIIQQLEGNKLGLDNRRLTRLAEGLTSIITRQAIDYKTAEYNLRKRDQVYRISFKTQDGASDFIEVRA